MATICIKDIPASHVLDRQALASIRGGGAPWVFGWIRPYTPAQSSFASGINFVEINNYYADQMINQIQVINVNNTGGGSNINVAGDERSANSQPQSPMKGA